MNSVLKFESHNFFGSNKKVSKLKAISHNLDIKMAESFNKEELDQAEQDAILLLEIIRARREEIKEEYAKFSGHVSIERENKKQVAKITVYKTVFIDDVHGNSKRVPEKCNTPEIITFNYKKSDKESVEHLENELQRINEQYGLQLKI